jgi:hypothetical protein
LFVSFGPGVESEIVELAAALIAASLTDAHLRQFHAAAGEAGQEGEVEAVQEETGVAITRSTVVVPAGVPPSRVAVATEQRGVLHGVRVDGQRALVDGGLEVGVQVAVLRGDAARGLEGHV